jgi:hypothetical protein
MVRGVRALNTAPLAALALGYAGYCLWRTPADPVSMPDSAGYRAVEPVHTLGYPSPTVACGAMLGSMLVPDVATYHASILTESLFMSGLVAFLALAVRLVRRPSWQTIAGAAILAGVTATVRRTALASPPMLPDRPARVGPSHDAPLGRARRVHVAHAGHPRWRARGRAGAARRRAHEPGRAAPVCEGGDD